MKSQYNIVLLGIANVNQGLTHQQMDLVYKRLGLRALQRPQGKNLRFALKWSPVIVTIADQAFGHAVIVSGDANGSYSVVNPCSQMVVDFGGGADKCLAAGTSQISQPDLEAELGDFIWYW
jgi:hypothetical protein